MYLESVAVLNEQLKLGDFFLCANERQRHYWLGALSALGRVNQDTYDGGELRHLIDVVPFGLPAERPRSEGLVLKGILPGIDADDRILLWGGGLWDWLDPLTPIRAMERVAACHPTARLIFFESGQYQPAMLGKAKGLAEALGLLDRHVLFADWLPPEEWESCLLEADVGLSFHPASIEACFAFRTRLLDYLWAGLPIVAAAGDVLSDVVVTHGLGYVVEPGHSDALSKALIALLDEPDARQRRSAAFRQASEQLLWERVAEPLLRYCRQPWHAGDRDRNFYDRWYTAHQDHIVAQTAHAERRLAEVKTEAARQNGQLQAQIDDLTLRLQWSEERFEAAMSGRVMRAMTSAQQAFRRLRGCRP
jgi:glycosyltransferase involved in cell wall biosynthesis